MLVIRHVHETPPSCKGGVLAIGNFDGVHRGHQALIANVCRTAVKDNIPAGVMVFEPHPRQFFHPEEQHFRLTPLDLKLRLLEDHGLGFAAVITFDKDFASLTAQDFIQNILVGALGVRHVVIGYDFFFGRKRSGSPEQMVEAGNRQGFDVTIVEPVAEDGDVFSSTAIRLKLAQGDVQAAAHDLGRWWRVEGPVIAGAKRGTGLGFPTANIALEKGTALAHGIYAVRCEAGGSQFNGAAYLGTRPTFDDGHPVLEIFLFDFQGDLYGHRLAVDFISFIRPDRKFDSSDGLIAQMQADCAAARLRLEKAPAKPC